MVETETMPCLGAQSCLTPCNPLDLAHQVPLSMGFSRQEYWSRLPFSGGLPDLVIEPMSPVSPGLQVDSLPAKPLGKRKSKQLGTPELEETCSGSVSYNSLLTEIMEVWHVLSEPSDSRWCMQAYSSSLKLWTSPASSAKGIIWEPH